MRRSIVLALMLAGCADPAPERIASGAATGPEMTVYKTPTCGCCTRWVEHMQENGFRVEAVDVSQAELMRIKQQRGIAPDLSSCHTAVAEGYTFEGHIPADIVRRFLQEKPHAIGLAVPGMPMGSPGMEGFRSEAYDVLQVDSAGRARVYTRMGT